MTLNRKAWPWFLAIGSCVAVVLVAFAMVNAVASVEHRDPDRVRAVFARIATGAAVPQGYRATRALEAGDARIVLLVPTGAGRLDRIVIGSIAGRSDDKDWRLLREGLPTIGEYEVMPDRETAVEVSLGGEGFTASVARVRIAASESAPAIRHEFRVANDRDEVVIIHHVGPRETRDDEALSALIKSIR